MNLVRRIFSGVNVSYIVRAYVIGLVFLSLFSFLFFSGVNKNLSYFDIVMLVLLLSVNTILFPFSKLVWDEVMNMVLGRNVIFVNALFLFGAKILINATLWVFAIFVAPIGLIYIWFRTRESEEDVEYVE